MQIAVRGTDEIAGGEPGEGNRQSDEDARNEKGRACARAGIMACCNSEAEIDAQGDEKADGSFGQNREAH